jgi:hypothetical protein
MRSRQPNDYTKSQNEERVVKNSSPRTAQPRVYETIKARLENNRDQQDNRKHNSPDMNRYRGADNRQPYSTVRRPKSGENEEREANRYQRKEREDGPGANRAGQLAKNASTGNLNEEKRLQEEENKDYLKLHEKLNFIESKIAEMKRHVQKKREEKQQLLEARRRREEQREEERRRN